MPFCSRCGEDNPERARFCLACGAELAASTPPAEERKVVSVLFVDLVGFTARSDRADPEDVRARLRPYHSMLKREIERYGGTVEKFIGDAVMAVFGAPVSHEDDAERAVRAALRIAEAIPELNEANPELDLSIRAAVNSGEAVVSLGARPERGEGIVTGDVVNTASRLQGVAPVGGVAVGEVTYRATKGVIDYEPLDQVTVKGKEEPLSIWRAVAARSLYAVEVERPGVELIGREDDLAILRQTYARTVREDSIQLVTVTGEPGVGKSRLVAEFFRFIDDLPELISWRQGRCLPYGDGVTFWALGEIVKAQAGILESDTPEDALARLAQAVAAVVDDASEHDWIISRLAPLVGASVEGAAAAEREEFFTAWRTFFDAIATRSPLVLVVEDLHWADDAMLGFVEHLVDWSSDVPIMLVCTARPELYERQPGWGGGKRNSTTIGLSPLSPEETARLIAALLDQAVLPADTQATLLDRAGGNPLYTEEFVRMLVDRGLLERKGASWSIREDAAIPVPESVQAIIAARLDTLPPDRKALLHDASVVGKTFWSGALAAMGERDETEVREHLHDLARKELVRPARRSSMEGQAEYSFWHLLVRDVAYGQIPRGARGDKHRAAAEWIEDMVGERATDHAELLAHHYGEALQLARAVGATEGAEDLVERTRRYLLMAGTLALQLEVEKAVEYYARAVELSPAGHPDRARALLQSAQAIAYTGDRQTAQRQFEQAIEEFRRQGDERGTGESLTSLSRVLWQGGDAAGSRAALEEAIELLEKLEPSPELALAYAAMTGRMMLLGRSRDCLRWSEKAIELGRRLGNDDVAMRTMQYRGIARYELGDLGGGEDLRRALQMGLDLGSGAQTATAYINFGDWLWFSEGPAKGLEVYRAGIDFARRRGLMMSAMWARAETLWALFELGHWDELLRVAGDLEAWDAAHGRGNVGVLALTYRAHVLAYRGKTQTALPLVEEFLPRARLAEDPQILVPALGVAAFLRHSSGADGEALDLIEESHRIAQGLAAWAWTWCLPSSLRIAIALGEHDLARRLSGGISAYVTRDRCTMATATALLTEAQGEYEAAVGLHDATTDTWTRFGHMLERGQGLLGAGRCLVRVGRLEEATTRLEDARAVFVSLRAAPLVEETDELLTRATALSS